MVSVSCVNLAQDLQGSRSPVRGEEGACFLNPDLLVSGSPSPGKRSDKGCSPLRDGGHSPARLSPRNHSPLMGRLRTPSPVPRRMGSYSPSRCSKSWLGLQRVWSEVMDRPERKAEKSMSVPNLVVCADDCR